MHEYGSPNADVVLLQPIGEHDLGSMEQERNTPSAQQIPNGRDDLPGDAKRRMAIPRISLASELGQQDFHWIGFQVEDWNKDLSPWRSPAVFGNDDFGDGAQDTLNKILKYCNDPDKTYYLGGYSLAGLFALWAAYQTDVFNGIAAASPSMWFPGFDDYMVTHELKSNHIYLSLGDKEEKTQNPIMRTVGDKIRAAYAGLEAKNVDCILEWNQGNHFKEPG